MKCAMLFPGQASQYVGMGKDFYDAFEEVRELYQAANRTLGFDIAAMSFEGDLEELTRTHNAQPAILVHSLAAYRVLVARGVKPAVVAGHSLGEFTALVAAGFFSEMDALMIVRRRGELMYDAGLGEPGTMAAVIGADEAQTAALVEEAASEGILVIANFNAPGQYAISGEVAAIDKAIALARSHGARKAIPLRVSGAFHSPLMEKTAEDLRSYMRKFKIGHLGVKWIANVTGDIVDDETQVPSLLSRQLSSPVQWIRSMETLAAGFNGTVLEVGPGKVLTGLMKRISRDTTVLPLSDVEALESIGPVS